MYLPLLAGGESMGEKWFGLLSTEEHKHSTTRGEGANQSQYEKKNNRHKRTQPRKLRNRRGLEVWLGYWELDSPLFAWTLNISVPQSPPCLLLQQQGLAPTPLAHAAEQINEGSHWRTGSPATMYKCHLRHHLTAERPRTRPGARSWKL